MADSTNLPPLAPARGGVTQSNPKGWDKLVLGGWTLPGFAKVTRANLRTKIDQKKKPGHGANPTLYGLIPQPVEVELTTYSDADREQLMNILGELPLPGRVSVPVSKTEPDPNIISISHPSLRRPDPAR